MQFVLKNHTHLLQYRRANSHQHRHMQQVSAGVFGIVHLWFLLDFDSMRVISVH